MPDRIARLIADEDDSNTTPCIISSIAALLRRDPNVEQAFLCTEHVVHIHKLRDEGAHFCGYRNMQMLCLALGQSGKYKGDEYDLRQRLNIIELQDTIERAWDGGINVHGREQIGDIKGTWKHVGTSEVCSSSAQESCFRLMETG